MNDGTRGTDASGPDGALVRSRKALERSRAVHESLKAAVGARDRVEREMAMDEYMAAFLAGDPKSYPEYGGEAFGERRRGQEAALREARAKEAEALDELARATEELRDATVEPRVEGMKLRFETRKLQATLSAGVLVGAATVTEVLLPPDPGYVFVLYVAYAAFVVSLSGCVSDMNRIAIYVENLLTGGRTEVEEPGWREKVSRADMWVNQRSLAFGLAAFALFATLNLA